MFHTDCLSRNETIETVFLRPKYDNKEERRMRGEGEERQRENTAQFVLIVSIPSSRS